MSADEKPGISKGSLSLSGWQKDLIFIVIIILLAMAVRSYDIMGPGITWDEPFYVHAGITYINNIAHLNFSEKSWYENTEHPPVAKYIYGIAIMLFNGGTYDLNAFYVSKMASALMGVITCIVTYLIGRDFFDRRIGLASALILAFIPGFLAHNQIAAIDTPLAMFFAITMYLFMWALRSGRLAMYVAAALSFAVMFDTKYNAILVLPIIIILYLIHRHREIRATNADKPLGWTEKLALYIPPLKALIALCVLIGAVIYLLWPWVWLDPINLGRSVTFWKYIPFEYFLGHEQRAPIYYYAAYFMVTTPALLLIPLAAGVLSAFRSKDLYKYAILLWLIVPFAYNVGFVVQGGMRYLLMIYPAVALLCAYGIGAISLWIASLKLPFANDKAIFVLLSALTLVYLVMTVAAYNPYYLDYYNSLAGGASNVYDNKLFNVGWWCEGEYECVKYIDSTAAPSSTVFMAAPNHFIGLYGENATYICPPLPDHGQVLAINATDYVVTNMFTEEYLKLQFPANATYTKVYVAEVQGAPLATVYKKVQ